MTSTDATSVQVLRHPAAPAVTEHARPGYAARKPGELARLRKIEGQVRGVTRMVEADRYCVDVLTQVSAITRALQEVALGLLDDHLRHCVLDAARTDPADPAAAAATFDELTVALRRALRL